MCAIIDEYCCKYNIEHIVNLYPSNNITYQKNRQFMLIFSISLKVLDWYYIFKHGQLWTVGFNILNNCSFFNIRAMLKLFFFQLL